ncbi:MAG: thioredoxin family protein [Planctomycetales bacterium]|nr:thioredoxin family protein [Planctomycetales bacterium]
MKWTPRRKRNSGQHSSLHEFVFFTALFLVTSVFSSLQVYGQGKFGGGGFTLEAPPGFGVPTGSQVELSAWYHVDKSHSRGLLFVEAQISDGWHMYSNTQPSGGPLPTEISLSGTNIELTGPFVPDHQPDISKNDIWPDLPIEEHHGIVIWKAPFRSSGGFSPSDQISVKLDGQACMTDGACVPISEKLNAKFKEYLDTPAETKTQLRVGSSHAVWNASLTAGTVRAGDSVDLVITANLDPGYHVYLYKGDAETNFRTLMVAEQKSGLLFRDPIANGNVESLQLDDQAIEFYTDQAIWKIPIDVPANSGLGEHPIEFLVAFMTCDDQSCDQPVALSITGTLNVGTTTAGSESLQLREAEYRLVEGSDKLATWIDRKSNEQPSPSMAVATPASSLTAWHLLLALAGGFILNFMPCVLPVIGLKIMSFVGQAGNQRGRIVTLNLAFVAGIMAVMMSLGVLTVAAKVISGEAFGWGQQFTVLEFKVTLAALIFAMALSFLGVWEIPIPGFATSSQSGRLMEKEGLTGAFLKGVLTTILATPCSGPMLGALFGLSLTLSAVSVLILYFVVSLGMSLPYLALCIYTDAVKFLPKPGAWMETLKQALAFPLLFTVVFFVSSIDNDHRIATLLLLMFVWFACWLIGRVPAYAEAVRLRTTWATGIALVVFGAFVSFQYFGPNRHDLPWVPYNESALTKYRQEGRVVMIDFTANWCVNCQVNMKLAIDRESVADLVARNDVVPMVADWTDRSAEILKKLQELESNSIPLLAIYPPTPDAEPIVLRDLITESQLLSALESAGPSKPGDRIADSSLLGSSANH